MAERMQSGTYAAARPFVFFLSDETVNYDNGCDDFNREVVKGALPQVTLHGGCNPDRHQTHMGRRLAEILIHTAAVWVTGSAFAPPISRCSHAAAASSFSPQ